MKEKRNVKPHSAFAYCVRIIVIFALISFACLLGTFGMIALYGLKKETMEATVGVLMIFLFNLSLVCPMLITKKLIGPLKKLELASRQLAKGDFTATLTYEDDILELQSLFTNMQSMSKELSSVETLRSDFVSNVSHEFKTPLASIEGYATLLQNPDMTEEERRDCIDKILTGTGRLSTLVSNVLLLSRLEQDKIVPELTDYRLDDQIMQILLEQEPAWEKKGLDFALDLPPIFYHGAETLLYHVWSNLISNAIKYSPEGGKIQVSLRCHSGFEADAAKKWIEFQISDQGPGISASDIPHIFDKFYQADTAHKKEGNGLGLAQVKEILCLLNGSVKAESDGKKGSVFMVSLPVLENGAS